MRLDQPPYASGLKPELKHGFVYSDCRVDDARLVIANACDAAAHGARVLVRTECRRRAAGRRPAGRSSCPNGETVGARAIVNAAGPWVKGVLNERLQQPSADAVRLVKGSHIVLPRLYQGEHAFILQNDDRRVVFMIPYHEDYTLVGTTDVPLEREPENAAAELRGSRLPVPRGRALSGAAAAGLGRALALCRGAAALRRRLGGRLVGDARLHAAGRRRGGSRSGALRVRRQDHHLPHAGRARDGKAGALFSRHEGAPGPARTPLPGSDFADRERAQSEFFHRYRGKPSEVLRGVFRRHGARAAQVLGDGELGEHYGAGLTERELRYFIEHEWARTAEDVLWRRSKAGLAMSEAQRARVAEAMAR